jgi:hypothetical protein
MRSSSEASAPHDPSHAAIDNCCHRRLSVRTLKDVRDCFRRALNCAMDDELISRNVVKLAKLPASYGD